MTSGDLTITHAHRTALRRIRDGEPVGDLGGALGALYLHDLIRDSEVTGRPVLTPDGLGLLAAHDRLGQTRRVERPRLEPRRLPQGWRIDIAPGRYVHQVHGPYLDLDTLNDPDELARYIRLTSDTLELLRWVEHSRAVEAQDDANAPGDRVGGTEHQATPRAIRGSGPAGIDSGEEAGDAARRQSETAPQRLPADQTREVAS
jgi:hypothetical protein